MVDQEMNYQTINCDKTLHYIKIKIAEAETEMEHAEVVPMNIHKNTDVPNVFSVLYFSVFYKTCHK